MGMKSIFSNAADFSGMTDSQVQVDDVLHKTYIRLDKDGTKEAAVKTMIIKNTAFPEKRVRKNVYLDRPFVYAILDTETGIPLFLGILKQV